MRGIKELLHEEAGAKVTDFKTQADAAAATSDAANSSSAEDGGVYDFFGVGSAEGYPGESGNASVGRSLRVASPSDRGSMSSASAMVKVSEDEVAAKKAAFVPVVPAARATWSADRVVVGGLRMRELWRARARWKPCLGIDPQTTLGLSCVGESE